MTQAPKIIHPCNHLIVQKTRKYGDIQMVKSNNLYDNIPRNIKINRIDKVKSLDGKIYKKGHHYTQSISQDIIEWINSEGVPLEGENYIVSASYIYTSSTKYPVNECPRCNGNGWYSSITDSEGQMSFVSGAQKLIQDFIKVINTEDNGEYGSNIRDILGENMYSEVDINNRIASSISECQEYLINKQNDEIANGVELDDSEILDHIEVRQIYFARQECAYVISLVIFNKEQRAMRFNFKI